MTDKPPPPIVGVAGAARIIGCSDQSIRNWLREGGFPEPIRRRTYGWPKWRRETIEAWRDGRSAEPSTPEPHIAAELPPEFAFLAE